MSAWFNHGQQTLYFELGGSETNCYKGTGEEHQRHGSDDAHVCAIAACQDCHLFRFLGDALRLFAYLDRSFCCLVVEPVVICADQAEYL